MKTYDPDVMTRAEQFAVGQFLEAHGERSWIAQLPVRFIGPFAYYKVFAGGRDNPLLMSDLGPGWPDRPIYVSRVRWVGFRRPKVRKASG